MNRPRFLLIGIDPDKVDYTVPGIPAGLSAQTVHMAIAAGNTRIAERGLACDMLLIAPDEPNDGAIVKQLAANAYDVVVIGGGLRKPDNTVRTFEMVLNAIRLHAPAAKIAFNTNPTDSADAALRWL